VGVPEGQPGILQRAALVNIWHDLGQRVHVAPFTFDGQEYEVLLIALDKTVRVSTWHVGPGDNTFLRTTGSFIHVRNS